MSDLLVEVFESPVHGRGLRAKRDVKSGELILRDNPFTYVLYHGQNKITFHCDQCLAERGTQLSKCAGCKFARYCNKACQRAGWKDHKDECQSIQRAEKKNVPVMQDHIRLMTRTIWKRKKLIKDPDFPQLDENGFPNVPDVLAKPDPEKWGQERRKEFESALLQMGHFIQSGDIETVDDIKYIFGQVQSNSVEISDAELNNIGYGLYFKFSLFNHTCNFNCVTTFNSTTLEVRATKHIKKGEECFISYVDVYQPTHERRKQIEESWYFKCSCLLCEDRDRDAQISALKCGSNKQCNAAVPFHHVKTADASYKVKCPSCSWSDRGKKLLDKNQPSITKMQKNKRLVEKCRKQTENRDWSLVKTLAETNLAVGEAMFHCQHYMVKENIDVAMDACIQLELWDRALEYGMQSLGPYREFYPEYHPAVGLQCIRIGKIYLYLERLQEAQKMFHQANNIICITHGNDHPLMKILRELLFNCEEEMRVKRMESLSMAEDID